MQTRRLAVVVAWMLVCAPGRAANAAAIFIPLDQQINIGYGNAIQPEGQTPGGLDRITFEQEQGVGFTRLHLVEGNGMNDWYLGPWVDLILAGVGPLDLSQPGSMISFDARYYQAPEDYPPGTPWTNHDAPIGLFLWSENGERDFGYPYHSIWGDPPYPTWTHVDLDPNAGSTAKINVSDYGALDMSRIIAIGFFGTNWPGHGNDFIDVKALGIVGTPVPEPSALSLAAAGALAALRAARSRRRATAARR